MLGLILTAALISVANAQNCAYSDICANHTMCLYPTTDYGANCVPPTCDGVNATYQQQIVNLHNDLRRRVAQGSETLGAPGPQPPAANMQEFTWDDELATIAQRLAYQCIFEHDTCRSVDRFYVGQNLFMSSSKGITPDCTENWTTAVQVWYDEVKNFNNSHISPFQFTSNTGHYSQVVWANTYTVGCGFTAFSGSDGWYNKYYVCNYGPGGNYIGAEMYKIGGACTACPAAAPRCNNGLCV